MHIEFETVRWARIRRDYADWWAGRLDRPLISMTLSGYEPRMRKPEVPLYGFTSFYGLDTPVEQVVDTWQWALEGQRYLGDAFPVVNLGQSSDLLL